MAALTFTFASLTRLHGPIGVAIPGDLDAALHVVLEGHVFVTVDGQAPLTLEAGQLVVLPVDRPHTVAAAFAGRLVAARDLRRRLVGAGITLRIGDGPHRATVLTVALQMRTPWTNKLLCVLPAAVVVTGDSADRAWAVAVRLAQEIREDQPGRDFLVRRYSEVLLIESLRPEITDARAASLLRGMGDRGLRLALEAIHRECAHEWTVAELARVARMSRSVLAQRFRTRIGVSPRQYLIDWRMRRAAKLLGSTDLSVAEVARATGYASEPAFARTFKRATGLSPGRFRRERQG